AAGGDDARESGSTVAGGGASIQSCNSSVKAKTRAREPPGKRCTGSERSFSQRLTVRSSRSKNGAIHFHESRRRFGVAAFSSTDILQQCPECPGLTLKLRQWVVKYKPAFGNSARNHCGRAISRGQRSFARAMSPNAPSCPLSNEGEFVQVSKTRTTPRW